MQFKIDKGVPIPKPYHGKGSAKYPWADMKKGDSFFVPLNGKKNSPVSGGALNAAGKRHGFKFTQRKVTEGRKKGLRIWRTA